MHAGEIHGEEFSLSASRALQILSAFSPGQLDLGVSELSRMLGLSKPSVARFLSALERHRYVEQDPVTRRFSLGSEVYRLGSLFTPFGRLVALARPILDELVAASGFTAYLSIRRQDAMVLLAAVEGPGPIRYSIPVGHILPLHSSATARPT